ncbi:hypothetical protein B0H13DRAFT_2380354 [Mycena leptocephala]|nr:hypothetical protein B0H13DRAFT_2380354 [Mycena leptocephala]
MPTPRESERPQFNRSAIAVERKGKAKATAKSSRKPPAKTQGISSDAPINVDNSDSDTAPADARKASKKGKLRELEPEDVDNAEHDKKYFKCNLGGRTIIPSTKTSNGNIVPLKNHLKHHFPQHFRMLLVWAADDSLKPTEEELEIVEGKQVMTPQVAKRFQDTMAKIEGNIVTAMNKRAEDAKVGTSIILSTIGQTDAPPTCY